MTNGDPPRPEEEGLEEYARFMRYLRVIATVPKSAIYEIDPRLKPKSKSAGTTGD
jgi:hypothetical protein